MTMMNDELNYVCKRQIKTKDVIIL